MSRLGSSYAHAFSNPNPFLRFLLLAFFTLSVLPLSRAGFISVSSYLPTLGHPNPFSMASVDGPSPVSSPLFATPSFPHSTAFV